MKGGGGYPPFPLKKNSLKIGPKTVFFGQKMLFLAENLLNFVRYGGGGEPPHSVNFFPLVFRKNFIRYGGGEYPPFPLTFFAKFSRPLGGGGGTPLADKFRDSGF